MYVPSSAKTLRVSFVGMETQNVEIRRGTIKVALKPDTEVLDEVVAVSYTHLTLPTNSRV